MGVIGMKLEEKDTVIGMQLEQPGRVSADRIGQRHGQEEPDGRIRHSESRRQGN